jgi:hypothetical protein
VLAPGGRIRVSTPDLERLAALAGPGRDGSDEARRYVSWAAESFCDGDRGTPAALVLNRAFRGWGHQFLYDEDTLTAALHDAGFTAVERHPYAASDDPAFAAAEGRGIDAVGIEMRTFETLALEARRT